MTRSFTHRPAFNAEGGSSAGIPVSGRPMTSYSGEVARRPLELPGSGGPAMPESKTLTVGREIALNGQITSCDKLVVEGRVEADLNDCREIEVAASGTFKGSAEVETAMIAGRVEGKLTSTKRLTVKAGGIIDGDVVYAELEVQPGGIVKGTLQPAGTS